MLRITLILTVLLCLGGQESATDERVSVIDGRVSFAPPAGFKPLSKEQIAAKFPKGNPPQYAFANDSGSVSAVITLSAGKVAPDQLAEFREAMEQFLPRMIPGLKWVTREFVELDGRKWVHLEMTSYAIDTDIHNHMYLTSFEGRALIFGFNSTVKDYPRVKVMLEKSARSIRLRDSN